MDFSGPPRRPTLFIGCGGTGAKVLRHLWARFGDGTGPHGADRTGLAFLHIDMDAESAAPSVLFSAEGAASTDIPEFSLILDPTQLMEIIATDEAFDAAPHIARWMDPGVCVVGRCADLRIGSGQMRPLARAMAVTNHEPIQAAVGAKLHQAKAELTGDASQSASMLPPRVVIVAGLAGGTGSGMFLEVAAMVRATVPDAHIEGFFVMPGVYRHVDAGPKLGANGYAALMELNHSFEHPYATQWAPDGAVQRVGPLYDDVQLFDETNLAGRSADRPGDLYKTIADLIWLPYANPRLHYTCWSGEVNSLEVLKHRLWQPVSREEWVPWSWGRMPLSLGRFRRALKSSGAARIAVRNGCIVEDQTHAVMVVEKSVQSEPATRPGFWDVLQTGTPSAEREQRWAELAANLVARALPRVQVNKEDPLGYQPVVNMMVTLPEYGARCVDSVVLFKKSVEIAFKSQTESYSGWLEFIESVDPTSVVCVSKIYGLVPPFLRSLHGTAGLAVKYRQSAEKRRDLDPDGFLHTDVNHWQYADLLPVSAAEVPRICDAWRLLLLGVMVRVVRTRANALKTPEPGANQVLATFHVVGENEANRIAPMFKFTFEGRGSMAEQPLGQYQTAVSSIQRDARVRGQLQDMVNRDFIGQAAVRYEKLIGLAKYYKQCIFPIRRPRADSLDDPVAPPAYVALTRIEDECLHYWQQAVNQGSPSRFASEKELVDSPRKLLWTLRYYAGDTGETPAGAAIKLGVPIFDNDGNYNYLEQPPPMNMFDLGSGAERLVNLKNDVFELLPPDLAENGALRDRNPYFPWLALAPWWNVFLPSKHGASPPDWLEQEALPREHTLEMSTVELVEHFREVPSDGATERGGAYVWLQKEDSIQAEWVRWNDIHILRDAVEAESLDLPTIGTASAVVPPVLEAAPSMSAAAPPMQYAVAGGTPESLTPDAIAARIQQAPAVQHYVLLNGAWTDAKSVPAVQQLLSAPPVPGAGGPGLPQPPAAAPALPPPPAALALIPAGPFTYFVHGVHSNWVTVSGAELVDVALAQPAGQEGHIYIDGGNVAVTDHPDLSAAIRDRRKVTAHCSPPPKAPIAV